MNVRIAYWDLPENIIWIDLPHRRLQGYDNYWIKGQFYGVWNDDENMGTMYEGIQGCSWAWVPGVGEQRFRKWAPMEGADLYRGFMLTDEQASFVGLI
jgi:hypothetical protein